MIWPAKFNSNTHPFNFPTPASCNSPHPPTKPKDIPITLAGRDFNALFPPRNPSIFLISIFLISLKSVIENNGWSVNLFAVEVGARGYCYRSVLCCFKILGLRNCTISTTMDFWLFILQVSFTDYTILRL